jgi:hypothetical protein
MDRRLELENDLQRLPIAVVIVGAKSNRLADLLPLAPALLHAIDGARPGQVQHVTA